MFPWGIARPDPLGLTIAHLQQLPASRSCKLPAFTRPITSARTQRLTAKLASPQSESLLGGGTYKRPFLMWSWGTLLIMWFNSDLKWFIQKKRRFRIGLSGRSSQTIFWRIGKILT